MDAVAERTISVTMTQSEMVDTAKELSGAMNDRDQLELEKKAVVDEFKTKIGEKNELIFQLRQNISTGTRQETVTCIVRKNYADRVKEYILDGEIVDTEPLSPEDMQMDIE